MGNKMDIKRGDIFVLGNHRLVCGDATNWEDVCLLMGTKRADICITDPPYGVNYKEKILNDGLQKQELYRFLLNSFTNMKRATKDKSAFYVFFASRTAKEFLCSFSDSGLNYRQIIVWYKENARFSDFRSHYMSQFEPIIYGSNGRAVNWYGPNNEKTVWTYRKPNKNLYHPTEKPVDLIKRAISNSSKEGDIVLDLFGGSGSVLMASEELNRSCYTMEIEPTYCETIIRRWEELTGERARKLFGF